MDRVSVYTEENPDNKLTLSYSYYVANKKLKTLLEEINGHPRGASYVYDNDERLESYQKANGKREYTYDDFDRIPSYVTTHKNTNDEFDTVLTTAFTFASSAVSTTSTRVASMTQAGNGFTQSYSYTYDKNGNILSVSDGTYTTTYAYDSLGQLLRENNQAGNFTHVWEYDRAGNILSRKEYAYTTGPISQNDTPVDTILYTYGDADWGDLLTKYGDLEIEYDIIGNPERIGDLTLIWQHGRQLASMTDGEITWHYTYNADGLRTKRTDGTNTYEYVYYDGLLQYMEYNNTPVYFTHAPDGTPMGMLTGGNAYFYITNLQGDVVGIVDATGNLVVSYTYDAWGNPVSTTLASNSTYASTVAALNPLRYRGYVYDSETGLYYLQSRYYDPEIGRFINADAYATTGQGFVGNNMFAYCNNSPIIFEDASGTALKPNTVYINDGGSGEITDEPRYFFGPGTEDLRNIEDWGNSMLYANEGIFHLEKVVAYRSGTIIYNEDLKNKQRNLNSVIFNTGLSVLSIASVPLPFNLITGAVAGLDIILAVADFSDTSIPKGRYPTCVVEVTWRDVKHAQSRTYRTTDVYIFVETLDDYNNDVSFWYCVETKTIRIF